MIKGELTLNSVIKCCQTQHGSQCFCGNKAPPENSLRPRRFRKNWVTKAKICPMQSDQMIKLFVSFKGEVNPFFLFHHWVRIGQTKTSYNRQFSPKRPEVGQIFILRSNFDQNKDHMTSKQVRGPSKN